MDQLTPDEINALGHALGRLGAREQQAWPAIERVLRAVLAERYPQTAAWLAEHGYSLSAADVHAALRQLTAEDEASVILVGLEDAIEQAWPAGMILGE